MGLKIILLICAFSLALGADVEKYKEGKCRVPPIVELDASWMLGVSKWYFNMGAKYNFFRFTSSFKQKPLLSVEETEFDNSCLFTHLANTSTLNGFGQELPYLFTVNPQNPSLMEFVILDGDSEDKSTRGIAFTTMTDNKTFFVTMHCWDGQQKGWMLLTPFRKVPQDLLDRVLEHAVSLGFHQDYTHVADYSTCPSEPKESILIRYYNYWKELVLNAKHFLSSFFED